MSVTLLSTVSIRCQDRARKDYVPMLPFVYDLEASVSYIPARMKLKLDLYFDSGFVAFATAYGTPVCCSAVLFEIHSTTVLQS